LSLISPSPHLPILLCERLRQRLRSVQVSPSPHSPLTFRIVNNINELLTQVETSYNAADWSSLIEYLQQLILGVNSQHPEIVKNREYLLSLCLSMLDMGDFQQRWEITKVLINLGNIAIPSLIEILKDEDAEEELRWYAARTLGEFQHPDAITALVELLRNDADEELKKNCRNSTRTNG